MTTAFLTASGAFLVKVTEVAAENFETVIPHVLEAVAENISLYELRTTLDIKTGSDIAISHNTCNICTGSADIVPVADFAFIFETEIMTATVCDRFAIDTHIADILEHIAVIIGGKQKLGVVFSTTDRLDINDTPRIEVHIIEDSVKFIELTDVLMSNDSCSLHSIETGTDKAFDTVHSLFPATGSASESIVSIFETVNTYGDSIHADSFKVFSDTVINESSITGHTPFKTE